MGIENLGLWNKYSPLQYTVFACEESLSREVVDEVIVRAVRATFAVKKLAPPRGVRVVQRE